MQSLRILLTNAGLDEPSGTVMYVYDVARELLARGHQPIVYSPKLGQVAERLSAATVSVVSDLRQVTSAPDVIHAQHTIPALTAALHFPQTPVIYVCHDWNWPHDTPPQLPRIRHFVAVDHTVRERLLVREAIPEALVSVIFNRVDLDRFRSRDPLPERPRRALAISNYLDPVNVESLAAACQRHAIALDMMGAKLGGPCERPENELRNYDLVFAKGRCAWEALAVGAAVIVCDRWGVGPLVTAARLESLRAANFGRRLLQQPLAADAISREIEQYDAADAGEVSRQIRATASLDQTVDQLLATYAAAINAHHETPADLWADMRAAADVLARWTEFVPPTAERSAAPQRLRVVGEGAARRAVRDELVRMRGETGLRKLWRSLKKRFPQFAFRRRAA
jgi:Glycosyltransferase Family 4